MDSATRILKVPQESWLRDKLREEVRLLFSKIDIQPPVKLEILEKLAGDLLKENNIPEEYIDFTMVLLGNESWRKIVKATPINRRLLLLPQCLRNNSNCRATFDKLGLICAGCKNCLIDDVLTEAEQLGYTTLVAEGTTVAIGLVEEGSIDAVIGVSCMPTLQRSFQPVSNAAVPVIGLPLMYDGCENTEIDEEWLMEEIKSFGADLLNQPISISSLKLKIKGFFTEENTSSFFTAKNDTVRLAKEFLLVGGQRMRPLLAALSYLSYAGDSHRDDILQSLAMIIECFHKASLVHDDIEDDADYRYSTETAHRKYGIPRAINAGDYLIGKGYQILSRLNIDGNLIAQCLRITSNSHVELTNGQGTDILFNSEKQILDIEQTLHVFEQKTGEAIKVALLLGAVLGGASEKEICILGKFSELFGISYQIRDDLNEFNEQNKDEKTGDFPFLTALLYEAYKKSENPEFILALADTTLFRTIIQKKQLEKKAKRYLDEYVENCYNTLDLLENNKLRLSLYAVMGKIFKQPVINE